MLVRADSGHRFAPRNERISFAREQKRERMVFLTWTLTHNGREDFHP